jgi:hypothetical protein
MTHSTSTPRAIRDARFSLRYEKAWKLYGDTACNCTISDSLAVSCRCVANDKRTTVDVAFNFLFPVHIMKVGARVSSSRWKRETNPRCDLVVHHIYSPARVVIGQLRGEPKPRVSRNVIPRIRVGSICIDFYSAKYMFLSTECHQRCIIWELPSR